MTAARVTTAAVKSEWRSGRKGARFDDVGIYSGTCGYNFPVR